MAQDGGMRRGLRQIKALIFLGLTALLWVGCETQPLHEACLLDEEVTAKQVCNGTVGTVSCVVKRHPQCDQSVCLSWYSNPAICTKACNIKSGNADCPSGDNCSAFSDSESYCVPKNLATTGAKN